MKKITKLLCLCFGTTILSGGMLMSCAQEGPAFYISGELPDIGEYSGKNSAGRFYEQYTPTFLPSEDYGTIIPFIGSNKLFRPSGEYDYGFTSQYQEMGFCTPDGKIVMDASDAYSDVIKRTSDDGFEYYTLYSPPKDEESFEGYSTVVSADGSMVLQLPEGSGLCDVNEGKIVAVKWSYPDTKVLCYSCDGELLFEKKGNYGVSGKFSHGLLGLSQYDDNGGSRSWYVNEKGEKVLGDYEFCSEFSKQGIASVRGIGGENYLINTKGEKVSQSYKNIYIMQDNWYCAQGDNVSHILTPNGEIHCTVPANRYLDFAILENGQSVYNDYSYKRCSDGSEIVCNENGYPAVDIVGNSYFICRQETEEDKKYPDDKEKDTNGYLVDYDGNLVAVLENYSYAYALTKDGLLVYTWYGDYEKGDFKLIGYDIPDKKQVFCYNASGYASYLDKEKRYLTVSISDNIAGEVQNYMLYDSEKGEFIMDGFKALKLYEVGGKKYFAVATESLCTLYNENFEKIYQTINE